MGAIRDRGCDAVVHLRPFDHHVRPAGGGAGGGVGPAVAGGDEAHLGQPEIEHRPRRLADILAELRADEDDNGGRACAHPLPTSLTLPANSSKSRASRKSL